MKWQIPYDGQVFEFDDLTLTASEARLQKQLTDGATPVRAAALRDELDPDAWLAALEIGMRRAGAQRPVGGPDLDKLDLRQINVETLAELKREAERLGVDLDEDDTAGDVEPATDAEPSPPAKKPRAPRRPAAAS